METVFSKEVQAGLAAARVTQQRNKAKLRVAADGKVFPVLRLLRNGFCVAVEDAPSLRGRVDLYEGAAHLFQCLIIASEEVDGAMHYEFKRATPIADTAPLDFEKAANAPFGLITDNR
ncbi:MAG: hypothetical protein AAF307_02640 [Pseudomonadota bacterium]